LRFVVDHYDKLEDVLIFTLSSLDKTGRWDRFMKLLDAKSNDAFLCPGPDPSVKSIKKEFHFHLKTHVGVPQNPAKWSFQDWYLKHVGNYSQAESHRVCLNGMFKTTRTMIHSHPRSYYENLLHQFETTNDELGHYMERADQTIFGHKSENTTNQYTFHPT